MLENGNLNMEYARGAGPHAVTRITDQTGSTNLTYDKNGNMLTKGNTKYQYDGENRLVKVTAGHSQTEFLYDGDGGRVKKTINSPTRQPANSQTIYIGSLFEVTKK